MAVNKSFPSLSDIAIFWPLKFYPLPFPFSGLHIIRINYGAMKTCVGEALDNVIFNILTTTVGYHKSHKKLKSIFSFIKDRS